MARISPRLRTPGADLCLDTGARAMVYWGMTYVQPIRITGSRIALLSDGEANPYAQYECTACGRGLQGVRTVVAIPRPGLTMGTMMYSLVHDDDGCLAAVA